MNFPVLKPVFHLSENELSFYVDDDHIHTVECNEEDIEEMIEFFTNAFNCGIRSTGKQVAALGSTDVVYKD